jgi:alpha-glucosidase
MAADDPGRFIESTVIASLNPPSAIADTSWIRAGRCAWDWWGGSIGPDGKSAFNDVTMRHYVDFAARSGFEYMLVDAGWSAQDNVITMNGTVNIPELVKYAAAKNVKIWIWVHWTAVEKQMNEAFALYEQWGVAGVKIDFMSRDDQEMMGFYYRVAETAARHRLMVDFHGSTKPTGMERTWPNVLGYEGVLGMEWSKATARDNPKHRLMIPFTRMIAGTMDYTPGGFNNVTEEAFVASMTRPPVLGTRAQQLAMYVVYECPFQMVSDHPAAYEGERAFQFIKDVPATWDETRVLHGQPGEYITIARRSGNTWFLGSMTGPAARTVEIPLRFLPSGRHTAEVYSDASDADSFPGRVNIERRTVSSTQTLSVRLAPGGGCAIRFVPRR